MCAAFDLILLEQPREQVQQSVGLRPYLVIVIKAWLVNSYKGVVIMRIFNFFALCLAVNRASATGVESVENKGEWVTLEKGIEFQLNDEEAERNPNLRLAQHRFLYTASRSPYVAQDAFYSGYQQAWRMLGIYIECDESNMNDNNHRHLQEGEGSEIATCQRYLMWAAYVDLDYKGGGIGEYQFWDPESQKWDASTCEEHGNGRCAKMDCHDPDTTTWSLLGVYKEAFYSSQWFEQLFKHSGYCSWSSDTYSWMKNRYDRWPEGCQSTDSTDENGNKLYLDLKPSAGGNLTLALYSDEICKTEYLGTYSTIEEAAGDDYLVGEDLQKFNDAMEVYKYCNPCRATNRKNGDRNDDQHRNLGQGMDDDQYDPNDGHWTCYDDAGYTNVNQCMKMRSHTFFQAASIYDMHTAATQGGVLEIVLGQQSYGSEWTPGRAEIKTDSPVRKATTSISQAVPEAGTILIISGTIFLALGFVALGMAARWVRRRRKKFLQVHLSEPLM